MTLMNVAPTWDFIYGEYFMLCTFSDLTAYSSAPLLGPAIGPMIGGLLTEAFDWRATFWFLAIFTGVCFVAFVFFQDTFRRERSSAYQAAIQLTQEREAAAQVRRASRFSTFSQTTVVEPEVLDISREKAAMMFSREADGKQPEAKKFSIEINRTTDEDNETKTQVAHAEDVEAQPNAKRRTVELVKYSLHNMNPIRPIIAILRRFNNLAISLSSGV